VIPPEDEGGLELPEENIEDADILEKVPPGPDEPLDETVPTPTLAKLKMSDRPTISLYCEAAAEYVRLATQMSAGQAKAVQIALSGSLAHVLLEDLRDRLDAPLPDAFAGERQVGGGLKEVKADLSEMTATDGLTLAVEIKPVHLAVGRAIWNRFGDIRTFAVNIHLKFPFAVVGGVMTLPTTERTKSKTDESWKTTVHLVERAVARFVRAGGRLTEGASPHLLEGIAVVVFDTETGAIRDNLPPRTTGLRWEEFIDALAVAYGARFGVP
jgi:hypothetical protein